MRLNLGSSKYPLKEWKNIDKDSRYNPDACYDIRTGIQENNNSVDEILISHVLMYFKCEVVKTILTDCYRVLRNNGVIRITEDNRHLKIRNKIQQKQYGKGQLFDRLEMREFLREAGFVEIKDSEPFEETKQHLNLSESYPLAQGRATVYFLTAYKKQHNNPPVVYLGLDDFGEFNSQMDILWRLRSYFDDFKVNLFAILNNCLRQSWLDYIKSLKWINLCIHGYNHIHWEELDEITLNLLVKENCFSKVYKAPFWELTEVMENRLKKLGFRIIKKDLMTWEIDKPFSLHNPIHAFGHIYPHDYLSINNNKGSSLFYFYKNIMKLPKNTKLMFY